MKLLTLGDSFTYGEELEDQRTAWPQLVADTVGYELINLGQPANSNPGMCRQLIEYFANNNRPDLIIVAWSSPGRIEFSDESGNFSIWPGYSGRLFQAHQPWRDELLNYIDRYHNDEYLYVKYLQDIVFVQNFLKSQNIRYLMLTTVANEYYRNNFGSQYQHYEKLINTDQFIGWPDRGMSEWTVPCKRGPNGHFLEEGHQQVAEKINEHIRNLGWLP
jgi:hypothetical protein